MARTALGLLALGGGVALILVAWRLTESETPQPHGPVAVKPAHPRSSATAVRAPAVSRAAPAAAPVGASPASGATLKNVDPNQPQYVGASRRLAADAVDAIARSDLDAALLGLGQRFLDSPARLLPPGSVPPERLVLDLTGFEQLSFVEQLLALANSRRVRTRTEAADRFSDHVRQLRYGGGRVERCARLRQPSLWALAAQRRGYLVDLSPHLPGTRPRQVSLQALLADPAAIPSRTAAGGQPCPMTTRQPGALTLAELPLDAVPLALPSLRSGDLFVLRGPLTDRSPDGIGLVDRRGGQLGALLLQPGRGVVRAADLRALARRWPGLRGVAFFRPLPNQDGKPER